MRISVLGSGSRGNSILVEAGDTLVLVDAGFSGRELERRLDAVDVAPASLAAILITHDHQDHTRGMGVFSRRHGQPIYLTEPTESACGPLLNGSERVRHYRPGRPFEIDSLRVHPFITIHDAADPVAWGDILLTGRDIAASYHLGVVVDDHHQKISHVVRGKDLYHATSVHRLLQKLLGFAEPLYCHHRLVFDHAGRKLAKSDDDTGLAELRERGVTPDDIRRMVQLDKPD